MTPLKVRTIDIFVSSPEDVQKERSLIERVIRSIAAEFGVPVTVNYSNWLRKVNPSDKVPAQGTNGLDEGRSWLRPCFWEYQNSNLDQDYREQIPNTGSYDLVVSILWSKLGTKLSQAFIMPDGTAPKTANEYEIAWVLDQVTRTPGFPELRVYRNRSMPTVPVQPRDRRETFFREWDAVQDFFLTWQKQPGFIQACNDYSDLQEFESLFREHFREFLRRQVEKEIVPRRTPAKGRSWEFNPFRGLQYFGFEHAPIFHGRTKAVGEVVDALKDQAIAKKPFVLILGPSGSGKTSLVRGGVLPLLTELATAMGEGPWRRAIARPGSGGDPFVALAAAFLADNALPELHEGKSGEAHRTLAEELRERPDALGSRIGEVLDQISAQELDSLLTREKNLLPATGRIESVELARHRRLRRAQPKAQLAIFVDQLEDLFSGNYPEKTQQSYISTIAALVRSQRVHVIAALRSEFYGSYQQFPELIALTNSSGRFDLQAPTKEEIGRMIRSPAQASGLKYEQETKSGKRLDDTLVNAALGATDSLPLLEHLLSQLYIRQAERKDGLLRWVDYHDLRAFAGALPEHAERVFNSLRIDAQQTFDVVMRKLVFLEHDGRAGCRPVSYRDLVSSREMDSHLRTSAQTFVDRMVVEGLFNTEIDHEQDLIVQVAHPALLRNWPRVQEWLSADQEFIRMRDRVDGCLKLWLKNGKQTGDLLNSGLNLADGETLLNHFHSSLSGAQIEYIQKSLTSQKRSRRTRYTALIVVLAALGCVATIAAVLRLTSDDKRAIILEYGNLEGKIAELAQNARWTNQTDAKQGQEKSLQSSSSADAAQRSALETALKESGNKLQRVQHTADLAATQVIALQAQLKQAQQRLEANQKEADAATTQRSTLEAQVKTLQERVQQSQADTESASAQRSSLEAQLSEAQERLLQNQQTAAGATSKLSAAGGQLKETQDRLEQAQRTAETAAEQRSALEAQLEDARVKLKQTQQASDAAIVQRSALDSQLKEAQEKLRLAQVADAQRADLEAQFKQAREKLAQNQQTTDAAASKLSTVTAQLGEARHKLDQAQQTAETTAAQRSALEAQLEDARAKLKQSQPASDAAVAQRSTLESQLKEAQEKLRLAQETGAQRADLEAQLKQAREKLEQNQQTTDAAASKLSAVTAQLDEARHKLDQAQQTAETTAVQRSALEAQLEDARVKLKQTQQASDAAVAQRSTLDSQLKEAQEKLRLAQVADAQRADLEAQFKQAREKLEQNQQTADAAASKLSAVTAQLDEARHKLDQAQQTAETTAVQWSALEAQLEDARVKLKQTQQASDAAVAQRSTLDSQLKEAQEKLRLAQVADAQRAGLEAQLKQAREKLEQNQQTADAAASKLSAVTAQLDEARHKLDQAEQTAEEATNQQSAVEARLKEAENKAQLAEKIADLVAAQAHSAANGTTPAEPKKGSSESVQPGRSGVALPLDAGQNPGAKTLTQPLQPPAEPPNQ
jgi:conflict system STAND superfamily ATPase